MTLAFPRGLRVAGPDIAQERLAAAEHGWRVFPLRMAAKRPVHKNWETEATCDPEQVREWWRRYPYANIGIACQPSQLLVLDLDAPRGPVPAVWAQRGVQHGRDTLALISAAQGQPDPVDTFTVATPRSGEHRHYQLPNGLTVASTVGSRGRGLGWGIDTRNRHGLVPTPGSIQVIRDRIVPYRVLHDLPVAPAPPWLIAALTPPSQRVRERQATSMPVHSVSDDRDISRRVRAYVDAAINGEALKVRNATPGNRHVTLYAAAAALGELAATGLITCAEITAVLTDAARHHLGIQDFTVDEVAHTIHDGIAKGQTQPRVVSGLAT